MHLPIASTPSLSQQLFSSSKTTILSLSFSHILYSSSIMTKNTNIISSAINTRSILFLSCTVLFFICTLLSNTASSTADSTSFPSSFNNFDVFGDGFLRESFESLDRSSFQLEDVFERQFFSKPALGWSGGPVNGRQTLLQQNGSVEDSLTFIFRPAPGKTLDDYSIQWASNNTYVLRPEDVVQFSVVEDFYQNEDGSQTIAYNVTFNYDFSRLPGKTQWTLTAVDTATNQVFSNKIVNFLIAGLGVYYFESNGQLVIVSGIDHELFFDSPQTSQDPPVMYTLIQYINGADTNSSLLNNPSFGDLTSRVINNRGLITRLDGCPTTGLTYNSTDVAIPQDCGFGFGQRNSQGSYNGIRFGIILNRQRVGRIRIPLQWNSFTDNTIFADEDYQNYIDVEVGGVGLPTVVYFEPDQPYARVGGENITLTCFNLDRTTFWQMQVAGNLNRFNPVVSNYTELGFPFYYQQITLRTTAGRGVNLQWNLFVTPGGAAIKLTDQLFSYESRNISLISITPDRGPVEGNIEAVLFGFFGGFDPLSSNPETRGEVRFSNRALPTSSYTSWNSTNIRITVPPQSVVCTPGASGKCEQYVFSVSVHVGAESNPPEQNRVFTYVAPNVVSINVIGSSGILNDIYQFGFCNDQAFQAVLGEGMPQQGPSYFWTMVNENNGQNVLPQLGVDATTQGIVVNGTSLPVGVTFTVNVRVTTQFNSTAATASVRSRRNGNNAIGVTLYPSEPRSIRVPDTSLKINALVEMPSCEPNLANEDITYTWTHASQTFTFSPLTDPGVNAEVLGVSRIGREFNVPQSVLNYGTTNVRLQVEIASRNLLGQDTGSYTIIQPKLVAQINTGSESMTVGGDSNLVMTGEFSLDPDAPDSTSGFFYAWTCVYGTNPEIVDPDFNTGVTTCPAAILPSNNRRSFTVTARALQQMQEGNPSSKHYIRYSLVVNKLPNRFSDRTYMTIELLEQAERGATPGVDAIAFTNSFDQIVDRNGVEFFDDLIITPISPESTWTYEIISPADQQGILLIPGNLVTLPGFWTPDQTVSSLPLRVRGNVFTPNTDYVIRITFTNNAALVQQIQDIPFTTLTEPAIERVDVEGGLLTEFGERQGDGLTVFQAFVTQSFENSRFLVYFFITNRDTGAVFCVSGCNGRAPGVFQIGNRGTFTLTTVLFDAQGISELDRVTQQTIIRITRGIDELGIDTISLIDEQFALGADSSYMEFVNAHLNTIDGSANQQNQDISNPAQLLALTNAPMSRSYATSLVQIATKFAQAAALQSLSENEAIAVLAVPLRAVRNTETSVTFGLQTALPAFYNASAAMSITSAAQGTTRRRLLQTSSQVNDLLLDWGESQKSTFTVSSLRDQVCGFQQSVTTSVSGGISSSGVTPSSYNLAVACNKDAFTVSGVPTLTISASTTSAFGSFSWCDRVFGDAVEARKTVVLQTSDDYIGTSNVRGGAVNNTVLTGLIYVGIGTINAVNEFVMDTPPTVNEDGCFLINGEIDRNLAQSTDLVGTGYTYENVKVFGVNATQFESYNRNFDQLVTDTDSVSFSAQISSSRYGIYGVSTGNGVGPIPTIEPPVPREGQLSGGEIAGIVIGILLAILLALLIAWLVATRCCYAVVPAAATRETDYTYVERDVYGRGTIYDEDDLEGDAFYGYDQDYEQEMGYKDNYEFAGDTPAPTTVGVVPEDDLARGDVVDGGEALPPPEEDNEVPPPPPDSDEE